MGAKFALVFLIAVFASFGADAKDECANPRPSEIQSCLALVYSQVASLKAERELLMGELCGLVKTLREKDDVHVTPFLSCPFDFRTQIPKSN